MSFTNARGQYGSLRIGAESPSSTPASSSIIPWVLGGLGVTVLGLLALGGARVAQRPRLTPHEKEVLAWEAEFPGLPWAMDQVKSSRQLDQWERARDYWERTH